MNAESLGLNHLLSLAATCQTVRPPSSALSSGHLRITPPHSSGFMPRCFSYQAASARWSPRLLKNTPPIPVALAIRLLLLAVTAGHSVIAPRNRRERAPGTSGRSCCRRRAAADRERVLTEPLRRGQRGAAAWSRAPGARGRREPGAHGRGGAANR